MRGNIFDIQRWSLHDGPGIRTNVFLKGCPLRCTWCSNPESQQAERELVFFKDKCIGCGRCIKSCPHGAITAAGDRRQIEFNVCRQRCSAGDGVQTDVFLCTKTCYAKALDIMGEWKETEEVMNEVLSDRRLYEKSGGGITVTGGEPFVQVDFLTDLLKKSKAEGLHTAVETCGYVKREVMEKALPWIDFIFVDMKLWDPVKHRKYTGADNRRIIDNLEFLNTYSGSNELEIVVRTPVIPGVNDCADEIRGIAAFIKERLGNVNIYQLLPYHRLGRGKYEGIGKVYHMADVLPPSDEEMEQLNEEIRRSGLRQDMKRGGRNHG